MPSIINVSRDNFRTGNYKLLRDNAIAIQIADPCGSFPPSKFPFSEVFQFEFLDADPLIQPQLDEFCFTAEQAKEIHAILEKALKTDTDIVVHCTAGLCRSGAVVDVGVAMGFDDPNVLRMPNVHVKSLLMREVRGNHGY